MISDFLFRPLAILQRALRVADRRETLRRAVRDGMRVGEGTRFVGSQDFGSEPFLIQIGNECLVTDQVKFITHDGAVQVPFIRAGQAAKEVYGRKSAFGAITIGDNCFIGVGAILLPGTKIAAHSIVGAGSVVRGTFDEGSVIAGAPGKVVANLDEYFAKNGSRVIVFDGAESGQQRAAIIKDRGA